MHRFALLEELRIRTTMTLGRRHVADRAVVMLVVIPLDKAMHPLTSSHHAFERFARVRRREYERAKQSFSIE